MGHLVLERYVLRTSVSSRLTHFLAKDKKLGDRKPLGEKLIRGGLKYSWKSVPFEEVGFKGLEAELQPPTPGSPV